MSHAEPHYKLLYEQSQQQLADVEAKAAKQLLALEQNLSEAHQQLCFTAQQLALALLEINDLRAKLFGSKADQRVKKALGKELDVLPLGATLAEVATSEALLKAELVQQEQGQQKTAEKERKRLLTGWCCLPIWSGKKSSLILQVI